MEVSIDIKELKEMLIEIRSLRKKVDELLIPNGLELISNSELCGLLKVTERTLFNYREKKLLTYIQIGKIILYRSEDVNKFIEDHTIKFNR